MISNIRTFAAFNTSIWSAYWTWNCFGNSWNSHNNILFKALDRVAWSCLVVEVRIGYAAFEGMNEDALNNRVVSLATCKPARHVKSSRVHADNNAAIHASPCGTCSMKGDNRRAFMFNRFSNDLHAWRVDIVRYFRVLPITKMPPI